MQTMVYSKTLPRRVFWLMLAEHKQAIQDEFRRHDNAMADILPRVSEE